MSVNQLMVSFFFTALFKHAVYISLHSGAPTQHELSVAGRRVGLRVGADPDWW